jgi:hypothetical protein
MGLFITGVSAAFTGTVSSKSSWLLQHSASGIDRAVSIHHFPSALLALLGRASGLLRYHF